MAETDPTHPRLDDSTRQTLKGLAGEIIPLSVEELIERVDADPRLLQNIRYLLQLASSEDWEELSQLPGMTVVQRREERPTGENCEQYVFGDRYTPSTLETVLGTWNNVEELEDADVVVYCTDDSVFTHIGRVTPTGSVVSKWSSGGHVIEHPVFMVPANYGDSLIFLADPTGGFKSLKDGGEEGAKPGS